MMFIIVMAIAWFVGFGSTLALAFGAVKELYDLADERRYADRGQFRKSCTTYGHSERPGRTGRRGQAGKECVPRHAHARNATGAGCHGTAARDRSKVTGLSDHAHRSLSGRGAP